MTRGLGMSVTRRLVLVGAGAVAGAAATRALAPDRFALTGAEVIGAEEIGARPGPTLLNDASLLNQTPVFRHTTLTQEPGEALQAALRAELAEAQAAGRAVNIGAARHSMGGQAIPRDGHAITLDSDWIEPGQGRYRVQAGTRWARVIAALDPLGLSPKVMQSNHDFGVGATFSVNAHGWPAPHGPMGSTVLSVGMLLADGTALRASRTEHADLFAAAMGGYGLIGLLTDLEVEAAPNLRLAPAFEVMAAEDVALAFPAAMSADVPMAYGRLNVDRGGFFREAMLITYRATADQTALPAASGSGLLSRVSRDIFRAQLGSDWVKRRRWGIETGIGAALAGEATRNSLLNEPVVTLDDRDPTRTDILHEYFVPPPAFPAFLEACRAIIPGSYQDLLNVTLRWVAQDSESLLSYAPDGPRIAAVMLFSQEMTLRAEADMARMTESLIESALALGGSYYLPYRLHATSAQFQRAYPRAAEFVALKRQFDPGSVLRNALWDRYLASL